MLKLQNAEFYADLRPFEVAMKQLPIRIVHIVGLVIAGVAAIYCFRVWALRFMASREGED